MPRLPVDGKKVIEHRITFGTKERELLHGVAGAYQFNRVATPTVAAISDVSFWITLASLLGLFGIVIMPPGDENVRSWTDAIRYGVTEFREASENEDRVSQLSLLWQFLTPLGVVYTAGTVNA